MRVNDRRRISVDVSPTIFTKFDALRDHIGGELGIGRMSRTQTFSRLVIEAHAKKINDAPEEMR